MNLHLADRTIGLKPPDSGPRWADDLGDTAEMPHSAVDSNSVRWVMVATVAFWLLVFVAGRNLI